MKYESALFIADSHGAGAFGIEVDKYLRTIASQATSVASCGSSPSNWVSGSTTIQKTNCGYWRKKPDGNEIRVPKHELGSLENELDQAKPNLTVVALGTNMLSSPQNIEKEKASIEKMIAQIKKSKSQCIWIGPPDLVKKPFIDNLKNGIKEIRAVVEKNKCVFIDSTEVTTYAKNNKDGIHYGKREAADWGIDASEKINQQLAGLPVLKKAKSKEPSGKKKKAAVQN